MTLAAGTRLGPYEVLAPLGAGGMGEVYRAKDTRLGRTVAIKVLPPELTSDAAARERLEREAKAISALSHPNICTLFDVGNQDGVDYLVMEHLEGPTLSERLKAGPLPLEEARRIAVQVASALARAHERGIVHRDLKPGNIMLAKAGADRQGSPQAKLLDFGLARLRAPEVGQIARSSVATQQTLTAQGAIAGTLPYMAPEQLEGRPADARADLFAFGAVLYEMVTGRRAFGGDSPAMVMAGVLGGQPAPARSLRPEIQVGLERLILACLAKNPADRWQSALDVALHLEALQDPLSQPDRVRPRIGSWIVAAAFGAGAALGLGSALVLRSGRPEAPQQPLIRLSVPLAESGPLAPPGGPQAGPSLALSRDGRRMVYLSRRNGRSVLVLRAFDRADDTVLRGTEGGFGPFFSPDGDWVAFFTETELRKVPLAGGSPVTICATPPVSRGGTWADDGTIYFSPDFTSGLQRVAAAGGQPQDVTALDLAARESNHLSPEVLPGGDALLFTSWKGGSFEAATVWAFSLRTGKRTRLLEGAAQARYLPPGHLVFARSGTLLAVPFDPRRLATAGAAVPVIDGVWNDPATGTAHYAVSHTGTLVYAPGQVTVARRRLAWVDRRGRLEYLAAEPGFYRAPRLSPDGRRLAIVILNDIWMYDFQGRTLTRTTFRGVNQAPVWTPDGRHITFSSSQGVTRPALYWTDPSGGQEPELLSPDGEVQFPSSWSPDGTLLAYAEIARGASSETGFDIGLLSGGGPWTRRNLIRTPFKDDQPMFSPDGRALAWVSDETGQSQVYIRAYPGTGRTLVSPDGGSEPVWSRSGTELFYRNGRRYFSVPVGTRGATSVGRPALLFEGDFTVGGTTPGELSYDVAPDGQRFIVILPAAEVQAPMRLDVVLNWGEDLRLRAPRQPAR